MIRPLLASIFLAMLAIGLWSCARYLMGDFVDSTNTDLFSFTIKCADESLIRLVDTLKLGSVALGLSSVFLLILFWRRRSKHLHDEGKVAL